MPSETTGRENDQRDPNSVAEPMTTSPIAGDPQTQPWKGFLDEIARTWPPQRWRDVGVVVGCSGGADSLSLLRALSQLRETGDGDASDAPRGFLVAAHFNHALREQESDRDETFVREFAGQHGIRFVSRRAARVVRDEATMRGQRMSFLVETAHQCGARYIALAHSCDDNVETLLHHLMRGTGPAGLAGIGSPRPVAQDLVLVRPLLGISRAAIRDALASVNQPWREDASNANTEYRRNWIRHELIPMIQTRYPDAVAAIGRTIDTQRQWRGVIDRLAARWLAGHRCEHTNVLLKRDRDVERAILVAALQSIWTGAGWPRGEMTREHWVRLADTVTSDGDDRYVLPGRIEVSARGDHVEISSR